MSDSLPAARHDAVAQLNDFGNADYLLGVVSLIGQQHQEEKYVGNDGFRIPAKTQDGLFLLKGKLSNTKYYKKYNIHIIFLKCVLNFIF